MSKNEPTFDWQNLITKLKIDNCQILNQADLKRGLLVACCCQNGREILLRAIIPKLWPEKVKTLKKEVKIDNFFTKSSIFLPKPEVLASGEDNGWVWVTRLFIRGETIAHDDKKTRTLLGYDLIKTKFNSKGDKILSQVDIILKDLGRINSPNEELRQNRYKKNLSGYDTGLIARGVGRNLSTVLAFVEEHRKSYFLSKSLCASHGDLSPTNLIFNDSEEVFITDFEFFSFDNRMMDTAFFWLFCWRQPEWQGKIVKKLVQNNEDEIFFRISVIRIILGWYNGIYAKGRPLTERLKQKRKEYKNHIWVRYLLAAGESFKALVNVK